MFLVVSHEKEREKERKKEIERDRERERGGSTVRYKVESEENDLKTSFHNRKNELREK